MFAPFHPVFASGLTSFRGKSLLWRQQNRAIVRGVGPLPDSLAGRVGAPRTINMSSNSTCWRGVSIFQVVIDMCAASTKRV